MFKGLTFNNRHKFWMKVDYSTGSVLMEKDFDKNIGQLEKDFNIQLLQSNLKHVELDQYGCRKFLVINDSGAKDAVDIA